MVKQASWTRWLPRVAASSDLCSICATIIAAQFVRFRADDSSLAYVNVPYELVGVIIGALWLLGLAISKAWDIRVIGSGAVDYLRATNATLVLFGVIAIVAFVFQLHLARGYIAVAVTLGVFLLLLRRWITRKAIIALRRDGHLTRRLVVIGGPGEALHLYKSFKRAPGAGYYVVGAMLPGRSVHSPSGDELPLPVLSVDRSVESIIQRLLELEIEAVAVSGGGLNPKALRSLSWQLADNRISLILAPALTDIAGPRIHAHPVADLPLIHVSTPRLNGVNAAIKRTFDIMGAASAIVLALPIMAVVAILIKIEDRGPIFFAQERIGRDGEPFRMYKFRSMAVDAEEKLAALQKLQDTGAVLFKMKDDPRITGVGRVIRRYSLDELPQLFNVLLGNMSLVGPRPPLEREVRQYGRDVMRKLTVTPGITGLWQVGGRSNLDWEESVRLDLYYVENWSIMQDVVILLRTVKAVLARDGAY